MLLLGWAQNEGEGGPFRDGKYLGVQKGVNSVLDMLSLRYREDQQRKRYQVDSWNIKLEQRKEFWR